MKNGAGNEITSDAGGAANDVDVVALVLEPLVVAGVCLRHACANHLGCGISVFTP